jgi:hypothetical protein
MRTISSALWAWRISQRSEEERVTIAAKGWPLRASATS